MTANGETADLGACGTIRIGYADPPYLGCCRLYNHEHTDDMLVARKGDRPFDDRCWDDLATHSALIDWLGAEFPDGWAMSATSGSLREILPLCPPGVRVGAWVKPFHAYKKGVRPAYSWEPLIYTGGRQLAVAPPKGGKAVTPKDHVLADPDATRANIVLRKGFTGAKPEGFCFWLFNLMGLTRGDELVDIFSGSGMVADAWAKWCDMNVLDFTAGGHVA